MKSAEKRAALNQIESALEDLSTARSALRALDHLLATCGEGPTGYDTVAIVRLILERFECGLDPLHELRIELS